jgi:dTDP-glucose pyrophosphorylase
MKRFYDCVILCAGRGTRMGSEHPKVLIEVNNKAILQHVIDFWKPQVERFTFVVGYKAYEVSKYLATKSGLMNYKEVTQYEQKGIADALWNVRKNTIGKFVMALGDCIQVGKFEYPDIMQNGCGVWKGCPYWEEIAKSYTVFTQNDTIYRVVEKPKLPNELDGAYCGMGTYFFPDYIYGYIENTKPSKLRHEVEITDVIQNMIDDGEKFKPVFFNGEYINMTSYEDIKKAELRIK